MAPSYQGHAACRVEEVLCRYDVCGISQGTTLPWNISTFLRQSYVNPTYLYGVIGNADSLLIATVPYDTVRTVYTSRDNRKLLYYEVLS
jgi:hypothetical protein